MSTKRKTTEEFIEAAIKIHGNKYNYSKVEYINNVTKVCIICPEHGEFWQTPKMHLRGSGCKKCGLQRISESKKGKTVVLKPRVKREHCNNKLSVPRNIKTTQEFIEAAIKIHGNKYDYSKVEYINKGNKVCIICPEHGEFWQQPRYHLMGRGCKKCAHTVSALKQKYTDDEFISILKDVYGDTYDYSKVKYLGRGKKITLICHKHGEFNKIASDLVSKKTGCPLCNNEMKSKLFSLGKDKFIEKANLIFNGLYDYSDVEYVNNGTKVIIKCKKHDKFLCTPKNHLKGRGCPLCKSEKNVYEERLYYFLKSFISENDIIKQVRFDWLSNHKSIDFYIPKYKIAIEHQGSQHFTYQPFFHTSKEKLEKTKYNDKVKIEECKKNNLTLIHFSYELTKKPNNCDYELILNEEELKNKILNLIKNKNE